MIAQSTLTLVRGGSGSGGDNSGGGSSGSGGSGSGGSGSAGNGAHCVVPKLAGKTLAAARKLLTAAHCTLGKVTAPKLSQGHKLLVSASSPKAGALLASGAKVNVKLRKA